MASSACKGALFVIFCSVAFPACSSVYESIRPTRVEWVAAGQYNVLAKVYQVKESATDVRRNPEFSRSRWTLNRVSFDTKSKALEQKNLFDSGVESERAVLVIDDKLVPAGTEFARHTCDDNSYRPGWLYAVKGDSSAELCGPRLYVFDRPSGHKCSIDLRFTFGLADDYFSSKGNGGVSLRVQSSGSDWYVYVVTDPFWSPDSEIGPDTDLVDKKDVLLRVTNSCETKQESLSLPPETYVRELAIDSPNHMIVVDRSSGNYALAMSGSRIHKVPKAVSANLREFDAIPSTILVFDASSSALVGLELTRSDKPIARFLGSPK